MGVGAASSATRFQLCALLILISRTTILCQSISSSSPLWEEEVSCNTNNNKAALFVFGDSLYDPGNNNYISTTNTDFQANFRPYGQSFFTQPTGRSSDGRLIPDFICEYARLPIIPPYLKPGKHHFVYGANFASGGAGALDETFPGLVVNLNTQLNQFKNVANQLKQQLGDEEASDLLSQSVYMISIGGNDYLSATRGDSQQSYTQEQYRSMIIGNLTSVIKAIYKTGGRKFSFITLPPLGCWPSIKAQNAANKTYSGDFCNKDLAALVQEHSKEVSEKLQKLEKALEGFKYSVFDLQTTFNDRMMNPSKYGFKNGDSACCGSGPYRGVYSCGGMRGIRDYELCENASEYLFFDSNHPSEVAYQQLAKLMWEGNSSITGPYNLKSFFQLSYLS
ncbi:GDSL esterase/lipase 1-like [Heracleum sosnowskyi]|uniref:GDSL esterase/lipase 1-like n=1 Tax=Heracleum sosnowskyi TaxID=360622 RepID=A0AAD8H2P9_9APIA|nr:GDSL esterase/lipase 1-like [Heracleum sosnowskyi]